MEKDNLVVTKMSHFVGIGLMLGCLLPHTSTVFLLVNPLLCLFYKCFKQNQSFYRGNWLVLVPLLLTLLTNLPQDVSSKAIISCMSLLLYFFCFSWVGKVKIPNGYFYFILIFILITQLAYVLRIPFLVNFLNTFYPISGADSEMIYMQNTITVNNMMSFRMGGLYRNSNDCSRMLTFLMAGFLILNNEKSIRTLSPFIIICYFAVLITGSRTGFVVASLIFIVFLFIDRKVSVGWRWGIVALSVVVFVIILFSGSDTFRGFNVVEGFSNSANAKVYVFQDYLEHENSVYRILLGYLDPDRFEASNIEIMTKFDADYGYLIFQYGFIGFGAVLLFFYTLFRRINKSGRIFFILLLWIVSSSVITSFRASFVFMLLLSCVYTKQKTALPQP